MKNARVSNLNYLLICTLTLFFSSACSTHEELTVDSQLSKVVSFTKGEYISFISPKTKQGENPALKEYYRRVFPIAEQYGLKRELQFKVSDIVIGDFQPEALILFSWPNKQAEETVFSHPEWSEIKALRPKAWEELRIHSAEIEDDITINFKSDKFYTVGFAWLKPENASDYTKYLDGIESDLNKLGGRYIYRMLNPSFEAHNTPQGAPAQLTFVEWDTKQGLDKLQKSNGFKNNVKYFSNSVIGFELHRITPVLE